MSDPFQDAPADPPSPGIELPPPPPPPAHRPPAPPFGFSPPGSSDIPIVTPEDAGGVPTRRRRSPAKLVGALLGVGALVAAGTFAVVKIRDNDASGGAASPVEVGQQYIDALENEDVLAVVDLLLPGERDTFRDPMLRLLDHLKRLDVLDDSASAESIGGLDIHFTDTTVEAAPTNVEDISTITLAGKVTVTVDGKAVPLGQLLIDEAFGGERPDLDSQGEPQDAGSTSFAVVQRGGRWYLGLFYTAAEQARGDKDIPAAGITPVGADTPEGALTALLQAVSDLDLTALLQVIDPTEAEALLRYAPLFLDDAQRSIDDAGIEWSISDISTSASGSGDRRSVSLDAATLTVGDPSSGDAKTLTYADGCITGDLLDQQIPCGSAGGDSSAATDMIEQLGLGDPTLAKALITTVTDALADYQPSGIAVHEVDGRWYVSPLRSYYELFDDVLTALDAGELRAIIDSGRAFIESIGQFSDGPLDYMPIDPADDGSSDSSGSSGASDASAIDECYSTSDPADAMACFQDGIAAGTIDPSMVSVQYRYPQCGAGETYWSDIYTMSDADFVAFAERVSPCFLDLVAQGEVQLWELPTELLDPSCLAGRNWYTVTDDEYATKFFACTDEARTRLGG